MNANDIKKGDRIKVKHWRFRGIVTILEPKIEKQYGRWSHRVAIDPDLVEYESMYFQAENILGIKNVNGKDCKIANISGEHFAHKVSENDEPILTATQKRQRKATYEKELKKNQVEFTATSIINKLALLGIKANLSGWEKKHLVMSLEKLDILDKALDSQVKEHIESITN